MRMAMLRAGRPVYRMDGASCTKILLSAPPS